MSIVNPVDRSYLQQTKNQDLRQTLQQRMVDLGTMQSSWSIKQSQLSEKCEDMISQLRDDQRQFAVDKNAKRSRHLHSLNQMIQEHQTVILDLQAQIDNAMTVNDERDESDTLALDHEIESLKMQIEKFKQAPPTKFEVADRSENYESRTELLEERLQEMQKMLEESLKKKEEDSRAGTQMLEQIIIKSQELDDQHQQELVACVEELNALDKLHAEEVAQLQKESKETKKVLAAKLKAAINKAAQMQKEVSQMQKQQKHSLKGVMTEEAKLKRELEAMTERQHAHMAESTNAAKRTNEERREFAALHKELEMLNTELARETVEHETLLKELSKIDDYVLTQMTAELGDKSSFSFSRF